MPSPDVSEGFNITNEFRTTGPSGVPSSWSNLGSTKGYDFQRRTQSVRTPGYRSKKPWQLPVNPYEFTTSLWVDPKKSYVQQEKNVVTGARTLMEYQCNAKFLGIPVTAHDATTEADSPNPKAISRLIADMRKDSANSAVALAELSKTASHVAHTATRLFKAYSALRKGRFGDFANALGMTYTQRDVQIFQTKLGRARAKLRKQDGKLSSFRDHKMRTQSEESRIRDFAAESWLEYSYGWKPLVQDLYDHANAAWELSVSSGMQWRIAKGSAREDAAFKIETFPGCRKHIRKIRSIKRAMYRVCYKLPIEEAGIPHAFGLANPAEVLWELLPGSFILDWFFPFGEFLSNLTAYRGLAFHSGVLMESHEWTEDSTVVSGNREVSGGFEYTFVSSGVKAEVRQFTRKRNVLASFPAIPDPEWKDPRSFAHAASAIALLQSLFLRK